MDFKQSTKIEPNERYLGTTKVYLESSEDEFIIGKWFSKLKSCISFESVEPKPGQGGGGCQIVIEKVTSANAESKLDAYGIVDRDMLVGKKDDLWEEINDKAFREARPFGSKIHVLNRWELENYLLHPKAIHHVLENKKLGKSDCTPNDVTNTLLNAEDDLVAISVLDVLSVYADPPCSSPSEGFGLDKAGEALSKEVATQTGAKMEELDDARRRISRFSEGLPHGAERWDRLSRMLDGKRILKRLKKYWPNQLKDPCGERGSLADAIMGKNLIDEDLSTFLHDVCEGAI